MREVYANYVTISSQCLFRVKASFRSYKTKKQLDRKNNLSIMSKTVAPSSLKCGIHLIKMEIMQQILIYLIYEACFKF